MASYSSSDAYKQHSPSKASVLGELKEAKQTITLQEGASPPSEEVRARGNGGRSTTGRSDP